MINENGAPTVSISTNAVAHEPTDDNPKTKMARRKKKKEDVIIDESVKDDIRILMSLLSHVKSPDKLLDIAKKVYDKDGNIDTARIKKYNKSEQKFIKTVLHYLNSKAILGFINIDKHIKQLQTQLNKRVIQ